MINWEIYIVDGIVLIIGILTGIGLIKDKYETNGWKIAGGILSLSTGIMLLYLLYDLFKKIIA